MVPLVFLSHVFDACISRLNCYDADGYFAGSGTLTSLRGYVGLSWSHQYCRLTPRDVCVSQFNSYDEDSYGMITLRVGRS